MSVILMYVDSLHKQKVAELELSQLNGADNLKVELIEVFKQAGLVNAIDPVHLRVCVNNKLVPLTDALLLKGNETIIYSDIVAPQGAYACGQEDGINFFFHTSENDHLANPHIHARYAGEKISIYFSNFKVIGEFKSKKKQKQAVAYVQANLDKLQKQWENIFDGEYGHARPVR